MTPVYVRRGGKARPQVRQRHVPQRRRAVPDQQQRLGARLRIVPGVEQQPVLLSLRIVDHHAPAHRGEAAAQHRPPRPGRTAQDADRQGPFAPIFQMADGDMIGVADQEVIVRSLPWPFERQAYLAHCGADVPAPAPAGAAAPPRRMRSALPEPVTVKPRA